MIVALAVVVGFIAGRVSWFLLRPMFAADLFRRENHRGVGVPVGAGLVLVVAALGVEAVRAVAAAADVGSLTAAPAHRISVILLAASLGLLGLVDDLAGTGDARGFRGHVSALAGGRLSTGGLKLVGGAAASLVAVAPIAGRSVGRLVLGAALVALSANLGNLFDRRPGRTTKVGLVLFAVLAVATLGDGHLTGVAVVAGAAAALLLDDLHEHLMLGDTGANVVGGVLGFGVVVACTPRVWAVVLVVVALLNLISERVSFTRVIDSVPPLRAFDQWGQRS